MNLSEALRCQNPTTFYQRVLKALLSLKVLRVQYRDNPVCPDELIRHLEFQMYMDAEGGETSSLFSSFSYDAVDYRDTILRWLNGEGLQISLSPFGWKVSWESQND